MKLISHIEKQLYKEIVIERSFLFFKYMETYRKYQDSGTIVKIDDDGFICNHDLGILEYYNVKELLDASYQNF
jgi:hypothetical protein